MEQKKSRPQKRALLVLEDGSEYPGWAFGKLRPQAGEVIFDTGMTGYPQALTDPANRGQIPVFTYPLAGNGGVPVKKNGEPFFDEQGIPVHFESERIQVAGLIVSELCEQPSHYSSGSTLSAWFEKGNTPGICGIDTRALAVRLRERGAMRGKILVEGSRDVTLDSGVVLNPAAEVSHNEVKIFSPKGRGASQGRGVSQRRGTKGKTVKIVLLDCGAKANILRCLLARNVEVTRVSWNHDLSGIAFDGIVLSGGPGDPRDCGKTVATVRKTFSVGKPIFGIGLGNQILALAAGADTYKLPHGHHGHNQPCIEAATARCYVTSQNHGYGVRGETLPRGWEPWFTNANDGTVEGIRSTKGPFSAVQFNPEGCPGPRDTEFLFDKFIEQVKMGTRD
jgi:carbamoyl-phosphate synthase small subunit